MFNNQPSFVAKNKTDNVTTKTILIDRSHALTTHYQTVIPLLKILSCQLVTVISLTAHAFQRLIE